MVGQNTKYTLRLRNVGNGPAYNIKFFGIEASDYIYYPCFNEANPILEKGGDEKTINLWVETPDGGIEAYDETLGFELFLSRIFTREVIKQSEYDNIARVGAVFLIVYQGINNKTYFSVFRIYSKIVPLLKVYDLVVEFIDNGQRRLNMVNAKKLCVKKPIMKKNEE